MAKWKRTGALFLTAALLAGMPLSAYMVSAGETGEIVDPAAVPPVEVAAEQAAAEEAARQAAEQAAAEEAARQAAEQSQAQESTGQPQHNDQQQADQNAIAGQETAGQPDPSAPAGGNAGSGGTGTATDVAANETSVSDTSGTEDGQKDDPDPTETPVPDKQGIVELYKNVPGKDPITITVDVIPGDSSLNADDLLAAGKETELASVKDAVSLVLAPDRQIATIFFALNIRLEGAAASAQKNYQITIKSKNLEALPDEAILYRINEQNIAEKIELDSKVNEELSFHKDALGTFVLILPEAQHVHTPKEETSIADATCEAAGKKTTVTVCSVCGEELGRNEEEIPAAGHKAGGTVIENRIEPKDGQPGSYEEVIYCTKCNKELSRNKVTIPVTPTPTTTPTPTPTPTATPTPTPSAIPTQAPAAKTDARSIVLNDEGETAYVSVTAENAPANASLLISSVDSSIIELVESSKIKNKTTGKAESYDVWFGVDISLGVTPEKSVTITLQSDKLAGIPEGALLYHVNPVTKKVRKTIYSVSRGEGKISFNSRDFSPFVILVKHEVKAADTSSNGLYQGGGGGVPTYYPAGDNGTGYYGGYNGTGFAFGDLNDNSVLGMNDTNVTGTGGFNSTKTAGENTTNTTEITNTTAAAANTTGEANKTAVKKDNKQDKNSSKGLSRGAVIGIIAAIAAAAAVAFGVWRYLQNGGKRDGF